MLAFLVVLRLVHFVFLHLGLRKNLERPGGVEFL